MMKRRYKKHEKRVLDTKENQVLDEEKIILRLNKQDAIIRSRTVHLDVLIETLKKVIKSTDNLLLKAKLTEILNKDITNEIEKKLSGDDE